MLMLLRSSKMPVLRSSQPNGPVGLGAIASCISRRRTRLREMVLKYMIHKPRGSHNVGAPCMQTNRDASIRSCNKYYPQPFRTTATLNERSGRAEYCRTKSDDNPIIRNKVGNSWVDVPVGNQWVVPYNLFLLLLLDCHVCVDVVTAASCAKYLYKYIAKGNDFAKARSLELKVKSKCTALHDIFRLQKLLGRCWALNPTAVTPQLSVCTPTLRKKTTSFTLPMLPLKNAQLSLAAAPPILCVTLNVLLRHVLPGLPCPPISKRILSQKEKKMTASRLLHWPENGLTSTVTLFLRGLQSMYAAYISKALPLAMTPPLQNSGQILCRTSYFTLRYRTARRARHFSRCRSGSRARHG